MCKAYYAVICLVVNLCQLVIMSLQSIVIWQIKSTYRVNCVTKILHNLGPKPGPIVH